MKKFIKTFFNFEEGIKELAKVSFSAEQALKWANDGQIPLSETDAVRSLAVNVLMDRPTGNGVGWDECSIDITAFGVSYCTRGGLQFGWEILSDEDGYYDTGHYLFWIAHPLADEDSAAPAESTLRQSATEHGWLEKGDYEYLY